MSPTATSSEPARVCFDGACDRCHAAPGSRFFDTFWVCSECAMNLWRKLKREGLQ